jgi:hypothetical protein
VLLQYPFGVPIRKRCETGEIASGERSDCATAIASGIARIPSNFTNWKLMDGEYGRKFREKKGAPSQPSRLVFSQGTRHLHFFSLYCGQLPSALTIIVATLTTWNTVIAVNCLLALWRLCRVADERIANDALNARPVTNA